MLTGLKALAVAVSAVLFWWEQVREFLGRDFTIAEGPFDYEIHGPPRVFDYHWPSHPAVATRILPVPLIYILVEPELEAGLLAILRFWVRPTRPAVNALTSNLFLTPEN